MCLARLPVFLTPMSAQMFWWIVFIVYCVVMGILNAEYGKD